MRDRRLIKLTGPLATPIYQTSTFCFETVEEGAAKFANQIPGFVYSRGGNPTTRAFDAEVRSHGGRARTRWPRPPVWVQWDL